MSSYCLVTKDYPADLPCPCCGCPPQSHISVEGGAFLCVACEAPEIDLEGIVTRPPS